MIWIILESCFYVIEWDFFHQCVHGLLKVIEEFFFVSFLILILLTEHFQEASGVSWLVFSSSATHLTFSRQQWRRQWPAERTNTPSAARLLSASAFN